MAYNYQQSYYGWPANANPNAIWPQAQQPQQQTTSTGALIPVPDEDFARSYPVAFGQSVSFRDENQPYIYTKTMGVSQMEPPSFKKYKLVEEPTGDPEKSPEGNFSNSFMDKMKEDLSSIFESLAALQESVKNLTDSTDESKEQTELLWDELDAVKSKINRSTTKEKKEASKK